MSIQYVDVVDAVNTINGWRDPKDNSSLVRQLVLSLQTYKARGEFNGSVGSAYHCLSQAEYELEGEKQ